jgi:hypothetical protein
MNAHVDLIAYAYGVVRTSNLLGGEVLYGNQSFAARHIFHHGAATHESRDLSSELRSNFYFVGEGFDHADRAFHRFGVGSTDQHSTILLDVDRSTGCCGDLLDDRSARADDGTDLFRVNLNRGDLRCVIRNRLPWGVDLSFDHVKNLESSGFGLVQRVGQYLVRNSLKLGVELQSRDACSGTGDLEVHVATEVFHALDVGEDFEDLTV